MPTRAYVSPMREAAAARKRERVVREAVRFLREEESISTFSLEAIARAAGVTRLTVYNQFGSRRGLLEAVFVDLARRGRLNRIADAMSRPNPRDGLDELIGIFCDFWSGDAAIARLLDATAIDAEFAQALTERNERRRKALRKLVRRIIGDAASAAVQRDAVDLLFALTSFAMYRMLAAGRSRRSACTLVRRVAAATIDRIARRR
jgi:AcrR family transcriptional regulator